MSGEVDKWSVEQCRDWLRDAEGWVRREKERVDFDSRSVEKYVIWTRGKGDKSVRYGCHPIPATLDAAASAMPERWVITVQFWPKDEGLPSDRWEVFASISWCLDGVAAIGTTELEARFRLAVKARMTGGGGGGQ